MKTKLFFTIILSCFVIFASAQIIHIPTDQPTIQAGINAASTGDTVLVAEGTWYENINYYGKAITVASNFILSGDTNHINNTIIDGGQPNNPDFASVVSFTTSEDTTSIISGFTITGGTGLLDATIPARLGGGIVCINAGAKIIHNKIIANEVDHQTASIGAGIACTMYLQSKWIIIEHNVIADNSTHAVDNIAQGGGICIGENTGDNIELRARVSYNTIENNSCYSDQHRADGGGIKIEGSDGVKTILYFNNNLVKNNYIRGTSRGAGLCGIMAGADIANNVFSGNYIDTTSTQFRGAAIFFKNPYHWVNIINNQIANNISPINNTNCMGAVNMMDGYETPVIVDMNVFTNNVGYYGGGFFSRKTFNMLISNNIFINNTSYHGGGLRIYQLTSKEGRNQQPQIVNNTFYNNYAEFGGAMGFKCEINIPLLFNNILWGNQSPTYNDIYFDDFGSDTLFVSYCNFDENEIFGLWQGNDNINEDPLFIDDSCHIDQSSPCRDMGADSLEVAGIWYYAPETDYEGDPRPMGDGIDIGADEYDIYTIVPNPFVANVQKIILQQNRPNPFADQTFIEFSLPREEIVVLKIFDLTGREITTIVNSHLPKGNHTFILNSENLDSGIYLYVLSTGDISVTKKMVVRK